MTDVTFSTDGPDDLAKLQAAVAIWIYSSSSQEQRHKYLQTLRSVTGNQFEKLASQFETAFNQWDATNQ